MVPVTRTLLRHLIKRKQQNTNDTHLLFKGSLGFPVKFSPWHMANRLVVSFVRVWAGHIAGSLLVPLQTGVWLARQNMALDLRHLQASAYHTNSDNLSEYGEAMLNLAYIFFQFLFIIIIISHHYYFSPWKISFPPSPPLPTSPTPLPCPPQPIKIRTLTV